MINSKTVDTTYYEHNEVVRFESERYGSCTGTLIAHKWILTADHCIGGGSMGWFSLVLLGCLVRNRWQNS